MLWEIVNIRTFSGSDLDSLLSVQTAEWAREIDYDFSRFAAQIRRLADTRKLNGAALAAGGEIAGYGFVVVEDQKGLIGDICVRSPLRGGDEESRLFATLFRSLVEYGVRRIECQLPLAAKPIAKFVTGDARLREFDRMLMSVAAPVPLQPGNAACAARFAIASWEDRSLEEAVAVVHAAYAGHVDAEMNDDYRTPAAARDLLAKVTQTDGSGLFCPAASFLGVDSAQRRLAGFCLAAFVAPAVGHIALICVAPEARGAGLGYELLRRSIAALVAQGAKRVNLTVSAENPDAIRLYQSCGFGVVRHFPAFAWDRGRGK